MLGGAGGVERDGVGGRDGGMKTPFGIKQTYFILDTRNSCSVLRPPSQSGDPPRILQRAGLESSGQIAPPNIKKLRG